jgi:hypothetical protein
MKQIFKLLTGILTVLLVGGCATSSPIQRMNESKSAFKDPPALMSHGYPEKEIYRIYHRGSSSFISIQSIRQSALQRADEFAARQGKTVVVLGERISQPPYILGNFPRIEIVFALAGKPTGVSQEENKPDKYAQLEKLKKLLDQGAITQEEYRSEKEKILK